MSEEEIIFSFYFFCIRFISVLLSPMASSEEQWHLRAPVASNPVVFFGASKAEGEMDGQRERGGERHQPSSPSIKRLFVTSSSTLSPSRLQTLTRPLALPPFPPLRNARSSNPNKNNRYIYRQPPGG